MGKVHRYKKNTYSPSLKKESGKIHVVNMSSYTRPDVTENHKEEWISYGDDNDYFTYLIDRYNGSATNNAAINGISEMIYGKGLDSTESEDKPQETKDALDLLKKEEVRKVCYDYKMMGQAALQVIYSKDGSKIVKVSHFPIETLRAEKASQGAIKAYYYHPNWADISPSDKPKRINSFGCGDKKTAEILYIKPYRAGYFYYSPVDYQGGIQYAELEEEIANYHLSNIKNGLAPSMLINFNNGVPTEEERTMIEQKIYQKFSGSSNTGKFIIAFNDSKELSASIEPIQLSDASEQYNFLANESRNKVMVSHRIVSGMLVGIKESTGLGNNAEELQTASTLMDNIVIRPMQTIILDEFEKILKFNGIELELYFKTLQPLEFTDLTNAITEAEIEEQTGLKTSDKTEEETITKEEIE